MKLLRFSDAEFDAVYAIMQTSFPPDERRPREAQRALLLREDFTIYGVKDKDDVLAFLTVYDLGTFLFVEHFAVAPHARCMGLGTQMLAALVALGKPLCLEVELPESSPFAVRRIGFYERCGFTRSTLPYIQPPLAPGQAEVPLSLMTTGGILSPDDFTRVRALIYARVYGQQEQTTPPAR